MNKLKYQFQVTYKDGSVYHQNAEDVSITDPKRSCFYDIKQDEVKAFFLVGEEHTYAVDLEDGHFEVDGIPFLMHEENDQLKDFRLIFFRRHTHSINMTTGAESGHLEVYRFGWQTNDKTGKNYQQVMQIE